MPAAHPFYGKAICRDTEQALIRQLLRKYQNEPVNEELCKKIYEELAAKKHSGEISIPFKVLLKQDTTGKRPSYIEVVLDTKV